MHWHQMKREFPACLEINQGSAQTCLGLALAVVLQSMLQNCLASTFSGRNVDGVQVTRPLSADDVQLCFSVIRQKTSMQTFCPASLTLEKPVSKQVLPTQGRRFHISLFPLSFLDQFHTWAQLR